MRYSDNQLKKWELIYKLCKDSDIKTRDLTKQGFKSQTVRRYRKAIKEIEYRLMGLIK
jgi:hypothetical protein